MGNSTCIATATKPKQPPPPPQQQQQQQRSRKGGRIADSGAFSWHFRCKTARGTSVGVTHASGVVAALGDGSVALPDAVVVQGPLSGAAVGAMCDAMDRTGRGVRTLVVVGGSGVNGQGCGQAALARLRSTVRRLGGDVLDIESGESRRVRFRSDAHWMREQILWLFIEQMLSQIAGCRRAPGGRATPRSIVLRVNTGNAQTALKTLGSVGHARLDPSYWAAAERKAGEYVAFMRAQGHLAQEGPNMAATMEQARATLRDVAAAMGGRAGEWAAGASACAGADFDALLLRVVAFKFAVVFAACGTADVWVPGEGFAVLPHERGRPACCERFVRPAALKAIRATMRAIEGVMELTPAYDVYAVKRLAEHLRGRGKKADAAAYTAAIAADLSAGAKAPVDLAGAGGEETRVWFFTDPNEECDDRASFIVAFLRFVGCELTYLCVDGDVPAFDRFRTLLAACPPPMQS